MNMIKFVFLSFFALLSFEASASSYYDREALYEMTESPDFKDSGEYLSNYEAANIFDNNIYLEGAIQRGDLDNVKEAIRSLANVNHKMGGKIPVLVLAAKSGHPEIVDLLLKEGANINAADDKGKNALIWAIDQEITFLKNNPELAQRFSKVGELLIEKGININATDNEGRSPLIAASWALNKKFVKLLLDKAANLEIETTYGQKALGLAKEAAKSFPASKDSMKAAQAAEAAEVVKLLEQAQSVTIKA